MKKSIVIVLMSILLNSTISLCMAQTTAPQENKKKITSDKQQPAKADKDVYTCPMHSSVVSDKQGKCPECKMNLVKKDLATTEYLCPMHPEVKKDKPGKCTKCGMNLEKKEIKKSNKPK